VAAALHEIYQRDDGMFDVVFDDNSIAGPFPTISFALRVASGNPPTPAPVAIRHFKVIREIRRDA
jgi:hypothetical protein